MLILVTYDVSFDDRLGAKRLRKVSKVCQSYGIRVQNSVFECVVNQTEYTMLKIKLLEEIDTSKDSIRIYHLGNNYQNKVEHFGAKISLQVEEPLIF